MSLAVAELLQALANGIYRSVARVTGGILRHYEVVESVYVHRSVGRGEVSFGRSDIDLLIVVRRPDPETGDGPGLASLYHGVSLLRRLNPALGHIQMHDPRGLERWMRTDTFRGSQERRSAILLAGKPAVMPSVPVRPEDAARWFAWWPAHFFSMAVRERNRRSLRKIAAEMWNAYAVAQGLIPEPDVTQKQAEARARADEAGAALAEVIRDPERAPDFVLMLAKRLHDGLFPPLESLREPLVFRLPMPPRSRQRVLVILPHAGFPTPAEAFEALSFFTTPELLHLYCHYVNPFLDWTLPPELRRLGFVQPAPKDYVRACMFYLQDNLHRIPGFAHPEAWAPGTVVAFAQHSTTHLRNGEIPPPMPAETVMALLERQPTCAEYYQREFGRIYRQSEEQYGILEELERRFA